jgi:hypothetical protein
MVTHNGPARLHNVHCGATETLGYEGLYAGARLTAGSSHSLPDEDRSGYLIRSVTPVSGSPIRVIFGPVRTINDLPLGQPPRYELSIPVETTYARIRRSHRSG